MNIIETDERTIAVENASYRWGFLYLSFGLLAIVAYRGLLRDEAAWDLMLLIVTAGGICTLLQSRQKVLSRGWAIKSVTATVVAILLAIVAVLTLR